MTTRQKLVAVLDESREILIEILVLLIFLPVAPKAWMDARKPREGEGEDHA